MVPSGSDPDVTRNDVRSVFSRLDEPHTPLTTAEVAAKLECTDRTARDNLTALADVGELHTRDIDDRSQVWWSGDGSASTGQRSELAEFGAFVSAVEDYAIFMLDPDGVVVSWNEGAERIKGYAENEIVGEHLSTFYTDADIDEGVPETNLETAVAENRAEDEGWRVRKDGSRFWADIVITAVRDDDGTLRGFTKVTRDMTEQREYEQQLRREFKQTEQLLRTAPVAIAVQNAEGDTVMANRRAQEALGLSEQELLAGSANADEWGLYDAAGDPVAPNETPAARVLATGEPVFDEELAVDPPDDERMQFRINAAPLHGPDGTLERVITAGEDITELKERERQLKRRKDELETELGEILGRISDAFYALDEDWQFTHVNERAVEIFQQAEDELLGRSIWEVFPEGTEGGAREEFHAAMDAQDPASFELYAEEIGAWLEFNAYPSETGLSVYFRDVTDRKRNEQELARYGTIVETINDGIYVLDDDGRFTMVNDAYAELTGYSREELLGEHATLVVDEDTIERGIELRRKLAAGDVSDPTLEATIETASGDRVPVEGSFTALSSGVEDERVGVLRDITERKENRRKLEESERRYRTLVEHFPNGAVGLFDEDLRYTAAGGEFMDAIGVVPEDRIGSSIYDIYPDEILAEVESYFHSALDGEANSFEVEYLGRDLLAYTLPIRNADDEVYAGMLVVQDITDLKRTQRRLEASNERLEQFAYAASHDLQEPLRMVSSYLQLIEQRYGDALDEDGREFIEYAVDGAERMRDMIDGLLEYSRVETQGDPFDSVDLETVFDDVRENLQLRIEETDTTITAESLPCVQGDANQLQQVFQNLLSNAIEYSGDEPPEIHISAERTDHEWTISVRDEGVGIDPDDAEHVFDVFQSLHNWDEHSGTGIGLALCERIVERHGGDIWVESRPDEGSTFTFTLPAEGEYSE